MNLSAALRLSSASLWHRRGILALVTITLTLSVMLLLGIQYLRTEVRQSFTNTIANTDLIVGARSGQLNLLLYSVFHLGDATNNIRWSSYQSLKQDPLVAWTVPLSLGDSYQGYRVVGTDDNFLAYVQFGNGQSLELAAGQWFTQLFDVVLGAEVARAMAHQPGDDIVLAHGGGRVSFVNHNQTPFRVSGVLAATGTPIDRAVYVSLPGLEAIHVGWEAGVPLPGRTPSAAQLETMNLAPDSLTATLVGLKNRMMTFRLQRQLNQSPEEPLTAILPGVALSELWRLLGQFEKTLLGITGFVVVTSLIGLATVLLTLQVHRKQEVAILRAAGASPSLIASLYLLECLLLALLASGCALVIIYASIAASSDWLLQQFGLAIGVRPLDTTEWSILAGVPAAALLVGILPALRAWWRSRETQFGTTSTE
ncbi:ABC transporter permease [Marinobacter zhejiangensis]|uniref:Putative ABC transport system permease protein n=1 Tax=Marinobacter zhejiangensis TaxID=488535 RepID=A0A1I4SJD1_9GAMM|nr:ABC transporter permease [Marinobacter zhejiangensis]SFM64430.1 putative ABC transport system permease protein [Marinobacter zhejiangensis]